MQMMYQPLNRNMFSPLIWTNPKNDLNKSHTEDFCCLAALWHPGFRNCVSALSHEGNLSSHSLIRAMKEVKLVVNLSLLTTPGVVM